MDEYDDVEIAVRLLCGEEKGIEQLVRKYGGRVANVLRSKFPEVPEEDRALALRYAAFKAARAGDKYDETKGSVPAWFTRIAINCVFDMLRDGRTAYHKNFKGNIETIEDEKVPKPFAEETASSVSKEQLDALKEAIEELPDQLKRVVRTDLKAGGKANTCDLAEDLGVGQGSIRQYRKRYKEKLHENMRKKGFTETNRSVI